MNEYEYMNIHIYKYDTPPRPSKPEAGLAAWEGIYTYTHTHTHTHIYIYIYIYIYLNLQLCILITHLHFLQNPRAAEQREQAYIYK